LYDFVQVWKSAMTALDNRAELTAAQDRLLDLLVQQDEASTLKDWPRVTALEAEIDAARTRRDGLQQSAAFDLRRGAIKI
jgi:hypothetical protein